MGYYSFNNLFASTIAKQHPPAANAPLLQHVFQSQENKPVPIKIAAKYKTTAEDITPAAPPNVVTAKVV
jgi:hypothetical protein